MNYIFPLDLFCPSELKLSFYHLIVMCFCLLQFYHLIVILFGASLTCLSFLAAICDALLHLIIQGGGVSLKEAAIPAPRLISSHELE